jgi:hypothetical protein
MYQRDPLSVRYDPAARSMIDRAIAGARRGRNIPGVIESGGHEQRETKGAGLSVSERAFQRALYHDERIHKAGKPSGPWSLKVAWGERIGRRRLLTIRVFTDTTAARRVRADYGLAQSYIKNPALRSTAAAQQQETAGADVVVSRGRRARPARRGIR